MMINCLAKSAWTSLSGWNEIYVETGAACSNKSFLNVGVPKQVAPALVDRYKQNSSMSIVQSILQYSRKLIYNA